MRNRWWIWGLCLVFVLSLSSCSWFSRGASDPRPVSGSLAWTTPAEYPTEVQQWLDSLLEEGTDWLRHGEVVYFAVARGESPSDGYSVSIESVRYVENEGVKVTVVARYHQPRPDHQYSDVITYPVAVAAVSISELPAHQMDDVEVVFDVMRAPDPETPATPTQTVVLFFASREGHMVRSYRTVQAEAVTPELVIAEIMLGPSETNLLPILPPGTKLVVMEDKDDPTLAVVDFSSEIRQVQGSFAETMAIYGVVNALLANDLGFESVRVTVEGVAIDSLGHLDLSQPLTFEESLVLEGK